MAEVLRQEHRIVVEGMDGSGKTTLISRLMYDFHNLELVKNPLDDKQDFATWWPQAVDRPHSEIVPIHDRFFYSEIVYGPILRGKINAPENLVNNIAFFLRNTAFLIYCRPYSQIILDAVDANDQMEGVREKKLELLELYDNIMSVEMQWFGDRFLRYDWNTESDYGELETKVEAYLNG